MATMDTLIKDKLSVFKCSANDALELKLVRRTEDIDDNCTAFKPEMTHQIYGDNESIFGYRNLRIHLYYSAASLTPYISHEYSEKVNPKMSGGVRADDFLSPLLAILSAPPLRNIDDFCKVLQETEPSFSPFGELVHQYTVTKDNVERTFQIYRTRIDAKGFRAYHERLQSFLLFYVDAASYIDVDDDKWTFYLTFEKYQKDGGSGMYACVGYMTVYSYYAWPQKIRPRISQLLILPPFRKQGHCLNLLRTFCSQCHKDDDVLDITVEVPSEEFQRVRDFLDVKNCSKLKSFQPEFLSGGLSKQMLEEARDLLKINKKQTRRVYEILRFSLINIQNDQEHRAYRMEVKKRLNAPFQRSWRELTKLSHLLQPDEMETALSGLSTEQRMAYLQREYEHTIDQYSKVLARMDGS